MERSSVKDRIKFLEYAKASCEQLRTQTIVGMKAGLLHDGSGASWLQATKGISAMLIGLIRYQSRGSSSWPLSTVNFWTLVSGFWTFSVLPTNN